MRTYWVPVYPNGEICQGVEFGLFYREKKSISPKDHDSLEVAVVPAAALKRLVEAASEALYFLDHDLDAGDSPYWRDLNNALSEWKGGAE